MSTIPRLPILSRLTHSATEWVIAGSLTRMGTGLLRCYENYPRYDKKPQLTTEQKTQSFMERCFMEGVGVPLHMLTVYGFQEIPSKLFENMAFWRLPQFKAAEAFVVDAANNIRQKLTQAEAAALNKAIIDTYSLKKTVKPYGIMEQQIYKPFQLLSYPFEVKTKVAQALFKSEQVSRLSPTVLAAIEQKLIKGFQPKLWAGAVVTLAIGILASAYITGPVMQWLNDNFMSKSVYPWLLKKLGFSGLPHAQHHPSIAPVDPRLRTFEI